MSTLKTDTLSNVAGSKSVPMNTVVDGSAKAWVNFNGTGTPAIRKAFNVSSITDNGLGDFTVNFTTAFADTNFVALFSPVRDASLASMTETVRTVSSIRALATSGTNGSTAINLFDPSVVNMTVFH